MRDGRMNQGEQSIAQQLTEMEAAGLGGEQAVAPAQARLADAASGRGPQWREWWRVVVGLVLLVGGVGTWLGAHAITVPSIVVGRSGSISGFDAHLRTSNERLLLEIVGVAAAFAGAVWLLNQVWPRRRTYARREVRQAVVVAALLVAGVVLWFVANRYDGLGTPAITGLLVLTLQTMFIIRLTGPDTVRRPANDPRGDVIRFLTPWPVMLVLSLAFCAWQVALLLR